MRAARAAWWLLGLSLSACIAHFPRPDEPMQLMERTYIGVPIANGQVFEAAPALHVLLWNGLDRPDLWEHSGTYATLSLSVLATVRMYTEASNPVRTPSYEPRLKLQLFHVAAGAEVFGSSPDTKPSSPRAGPVALTALELTAGHHSNGQKGCALADHLRGTGFSDFDCVAQTDPPSTELNLVDGSFTRNYVGASVYGKLLFLPGGRGPVPLTLTAGGGLEWDVPCRFAGCIEEPMAARYGDVLAHWRLEADQLVVRDVHRRLPAIGLIGLDARLRASVSGTVHLGLDRREPFGDVSVEAAYVPRYARGLGVGPFVRYHHGSDYLNIRFEEQLDEWVVGIVVDPAPPEQL